MNNSRFIINFKPGDTLLHKLTGATKVRMFLLLTIYLIMSFDLRLILPVTVCAIVGMISLKSKWKPLRYILMFVIMYNIFSLTLYFVANPNIGSEYCGSQTILKVLSERYFVSGETLWYLMTRFIKIISQVLLSLTFISAITPSEFAAGLYSIKVPYKICTIVSLAFRCIPDIFRDYQNISISMQARGVEMDSKNTKLGQRLKQSIMIIIPLLFSSFDKVGNIANAMDLRGFGRGKHRSYYAEHEMTKADKVFRVLYILLGIFIICYIASKYIRPDYYLLWYPFA